MCYVHHENDIRTGNICFLLGCTRILGPELLGRNTHNIVVHASDLPEGKGFSPPLCQILKGQEAITLTLFEAVEEVDAGPYYFKDEVRFEGHELLPELRDRIASKVNEMCVRFVENQASLRAVETAGKGSYFRRRTRQDERLDVEKSIREQFSCMRVADNVRWPLFFEYLGYRYRLEVFKEGPVTTESGSRTDP